MKTKQPNQGWEKKLRSLYFNWKKSNDFFECVLIPFISQTITQEIEKYALEVIPKLNAKWRVKLEKAQKENWLKLKTDEAFLNIDLIKKQERKKERERILGEVEKGFSEPVANGLRGNFPKTARVVEKEWETLKSNLNKQGKE